MRWRCKKLWLLLMLCCWVVGVPPVVDAKPRVTDGTQMVAMSDGVKLATSVFLPEGNGPWPAVLARTPYNKAGSVRGAGGSFATGGR